MNIVLLFCLYSFQAVRHLPRNRRSNFSDNLPDHGDEWKHRIRLQRPTFQLFSQRHQRGSSSSSSPSSKEEWNDANINSKNKDKNKNNSNNNRRKRSKKPPLPPDVVEAIKRNKRISYLGRPNQKRWEEILELYKNESDNFNNVNYATIMSQLQRIHNPSIRRDPRFLDFVDDLAEKIESRRLDWIGIREIANIVHAIGKMNLRSQSSRKIIKFVSDNAYGIILKAEARHVANIGWSMAKMRDSKSFSVFHAEFVAEPRTIEWFVKNAYPQAVANMAWACATMGVQSPKLFALIDKNAIWLVEEGNPQAFANTAWACATLGVQSPKLFTEIEKNAAWLVKEGKPQAVVNTAWACATLRVQSPKLFTEIEKNAAWLVKEGKPQDFANTAWACATLGVQSPKLFTEIEKNAAWLVKEGKPQDFANTAWACATLGVQSPKLFTEIEKNAAWLVKEGKPQAVANTAWACAALRVQSPKLFTEIEKNAAWLVKEGKPQAVANTAWACATLGVQSPKLFTEIETKAAWLVEKGNPQNVANTAWACATLGVQSPNLFTEIETKAAWLVEKGNPQAVANTAWACATLGIRSDGYFHCFMQNMEKFLKHGDNHQDILNSCYAIAILDLATEYEAKFLIMWSEALSFDTKNFRSEQWNQLAQTYAFVSASGIDLQQPIIPSEVDIDGQRQSRYQIEVSNILNELGFHHEQEVSPVVNFASTGDTESSSILPDESMLAIDIACRERMIAIECDGPSHFLKNLPSGKVSRVENGATKAKRRFLERLGWNVYNINYMDWMKAKDKQGKQDFLRSILHLDDL